MRMRSRLTVAAALALLFAGGAFAADMPESSAPPAVIYADTPPADADVATCGPFGGRAVDHVYLPAQTAYILAASCSKGDWRNLVGKRPGRESVLVYYNGGSMYRTDVTSITRPTRPPAKPH